jgi:hypothetical protein
LGASKTGQVVGGTILSVSAATGPAAPFVAAAGAVVTLLSTILKGGCGQACTVPSKAEQIYEVACQDIQAVANLGMLSANEYLTAMQNFLNAGIQQLTQMAQTDSKAQPAVTRLTNLLQSYTAHASTMPQNPTAQLDLSQAQAAFISSSAKGYYADSVAQGNQLALAYLQEMGSSGVSLSSSGVTVGGMTFSPLVIGISLLAAAYFMMGD